MNQPKLVSSGHPENDLECALGKRDLEANFLATMAVYTLGSVPYSLVRRPEFLYHVSSNFHWIILKKCPILCFTIVYRYITSSYTSFAKSKNLPKNSRTKTDLKG